MSFKNFLDLRKKPPTQIQIIEKIIFQKRSIKSDLFLALSVILVASAVIWGISKAGNVIEVVSKSQIKNFTAVGIVLNVDANNLYIDQAKGSDDPDKTTYSFNIPIYTKIETSQYLALSMSDIKPGERVIVQGQEDGGNIYVKRIIYFGLIPSIDEKVKDDIATSSIVLSVSSSTSTTSERSEVGTSTVSDTSSVGIVDSLKGKVLDVVNVVTFNNLDTKEISTTTDVLGIKKDIGGLVSTTTIISTSTNESLSTSTSTPALTIIDMVGNAIGDTVSTLAETIQTTIDKITDKKIEPENSKTE